MGPEVASEQPPTATSLRAETGAPRHIAAGHWQELIEGSAIAPAVAALNFKSFGAGFSCFDRQRQALLAHAFDQLNSQPGHSSQARLKLQQRYAHFAHGGWAFVGDALPGFEATHCWKPNQPRMGGGFGRHRLIKYEGAPRRRPGLFFCQVPHEQWRAIAQRAQLRAPDDLSVGFGAWLPAEPNVPLVLVEGCKKAAALISHGIAAVGVSGVWNGRIVDRDEAGARVSERLIAELEALAPGRAITICFDADPKASTAATVELAAIRTGHLLAKAGATVTVAKLPLLKGEKTGPDDLLVAEGAGSLLAVLEQAQTLQEHAWQRRYCQERRLRPTLLVKCRHLSEAVPELPTAPIVGIRSAKGTGKTKALGHWLQHQPEVLAITHRRSLGSSIASRLGLVWRNDLDSANGEQFHEASGQRFKATPPRLALCIDSLLALPIEALEGRVVVLDEAEQLLQHLLTSDTCRNQRGLIFQRFCHAIGHAELVVALDADLSDATLRLLQQCRRLHGASDDLALIVNKQAPTPWRVRWWNQATPEAMQQALIEAVGEAPQFVVCDSKRQAEAIHDLLLHHWPDKQGLLITSATTATAEGAAAIGKLTSASALAGISWAIASPTISSGLSIEHHFFKGAWGVFGAGTYVDDDALQALARVRPAVPRSVWCKPTVQPKQKPISTSFWPTAVEQELRQRWSNQASLLRQELQPDLFSSPSGAAAEELMAMAMGHWALLQSRRNYSLAHLRAFIKARLAHEGHFIEDEETALPEAAAGGLRALKQQLRDQREDAAASATANAPAITEQQAEDLRRRQFLTAQQQASLQKLAMAKKLALPANALSAAAVQWGWQWAGSAKRLAMLIWPEVAIAADAKRLASTTSNGALLPFDQTFNAQAMAAARALGLDAFVRDVVMGQEQWDANSPKVVAIADKARHHAQAMRQAFGLAIGEKQSNAEVVGKLLRHFGITTTAIRSKSNARRYTAEKAQLAMVLEAANRLRGGSTTSEGDTYSSPGGAEPSGHGLFHHEAGQVAQASTFGVAALHQFAVEIPGDRDCDALGPPFVSRYG
jgi:hypothetical protein